MSGALATTVDHLVWDEDGRDWPNRSASRFVTAGGLHWHVQTMGQGPVMLMLHGTGATTHSWAHLAPPLAKRFTLVMPDLPGHGFTGLPSRRRLSLNGMSALLGDLLTAMNVRPAYVVGHSAGAAIGLRMTLDGQLASRGIVSLNGALMPFAGLAGIAYPALAKLLFLNPFSISILARKTAVPGTVKKLIEGTGSSLDEAALNFYERALRTKRHIAAASGMMAHWDLRALKGDLPRLTTPLSLICGENDRAVPLGVATDVMKLVPHASLRVLEGLGHLAHEESPGRVVDAIFDAVGLPEEIAVQPSYGPIAC
jgi:magnesium chelatase accessory protein